MNKSSTAAKAQLETGRRGGDVELVGPTLRVAVKNWEGPLGCRGPPQGEKHPGPTLGSPAKVFSAEKFPHFWLQKSMEIVAK